MSLYYENKMYFFGGFVRKLRQHDKLALRRNSVSPSKKGAEGTGRSLPQSDEQNPFRAISYERCNLKQAFWTSTSKSTPASVPSSTASSLPTALTSMDAIFSNQDDPSMMSIASGDSCSSAHPSLSGDSSDEETKSRRESLKKDLLARRLANDPHRNEDMAKCGGRTVFWGPSAGV